METLDALNTRLIEYYGIDTDSERPIFRIKWANDETEQRLVNEIGGVQLLYPEVMLVKKYPYLKDMYVLERLVAIPYVNAHELPAAKTSYEPVWAYRAENGNPIYPAWEATKFIVDTLYAALGKKSMAKYVDSEKNTTEEGRQQRIKDIEEELFGNETETGDAMAHGEAIVVPGKEN